MSKTILPTEDSTFKKPRESSVPLHVTPKNLRWADKNDIYAQNVKESCLTCRNFGMSPLSSPGGWCRKFPCQQVNCSVGEVCDCWEPKGERQ